MRAAAPACCWSPRSVGPAGGYWAPRYWPARYWAPRYWTPGIGAPGGAFATVGDLRAVVGLSAVTTFTRGRGGPATRAYVLPLRYRVVGELGLVVSLASRTRRHDEGDDEDVLVLLMASPRTPVAAPRDDAAWLELIDEDDRFVEAQTRRRP